MDRLADYRSKRDFKSTLEPHGTVGSTGQKRRFVVQRHDASRLHYDLRLELDGVYRSWAVTKVPSLSPSVRRLAVEVEDHPLEYGTFEGIIPPNQYGGGTVQLWDRGTWLSQGGEPPDRSIENGHIKFELNGERMRGGWALVRMKDKPATNRRKQRHNWLLIKESDAAAKPNEPDGLLRLDTSVKSGRTLEQIAGDETRFGSRVKSEKKEKARSGGRPVKSDKSKLRLGRKALLPSFVEPQLCSAIATPPAGPHHEIKFDGYRVQMRVSNRSARLLTRRGLDWTKRFPEIAADGRGLPDCLIDGEVVALDVLGVASFAALQQALSEHKTDDLIYFAFDILHANGRDLRDEPLSRRKDMLAGLFQNRALPHMRYVSHFASSGEAVLKAACRMKLEGVISKRLDSAYRSGRSDAWNKSKCRGGQEVVIGGWWGDDTHLRSLLVGVFRDRHFVYLGRVGTGFKPAQARDLLGQLKPLRRASSPFQGPGAPSRIPGVKWVTPKLVAEVEYGTITAAGLLRQASFKGLRQDKPAWSIRLEEQPAAAAKVPQKKAVAMPRPQTSKIADEHREVAGIVITHPEKALWPASKPDPRFTKLDLAKYYETFSNRILPHVMGRPLSLLRAPDGIEGQIFFQRHANKQGIKARPIAVPGEPAAYLAIDDLAGLVSLAQAAVLELHPWGSKMNAPDTPERVIFDLDPAPDVPFDHVVEAAKELRQRLSDCGLVPFVKTTGGKGLHVVAALEGRAHKPVTWPEVKRFAGDLCSQMAADSPNSYTTTIAKKARTGRIFLDYMRNDRTATAVAPWSPRARPHAPIAAPLEWQQLRKSLDPLAFTLGTVAGLLKRADPWRDLDKSAGNLQSALKKMRSREN